jgi:invasion protein IalB
MTANFAPTRAAMSRAFAALAVAAALAAGSATAQAPATPMSAAEAQMRYERRLAECNVQTLSAPDRQTCVRNAGSAFDSERSGLPATPTATTNDGRATVVRPATVPAGALPTPDNATTGVTSNDGRATVILPTTVPQ